MRKIGIGDNSGQARRLTDGAVKALPCPLAGHTITWDAVPGFGVRVTTG
jgi:hypothetical protein